MPDQWSDISSSIHPGLNNVRRVEAHYPIDFRRGKDFQGRYIFILEGNVGDAELPLLPRLGGVDVAFQSEQPGVSRLTLTLLETEEIEIFRALCHDLLSSTSGLPRGENGKGLLVVLNRLTRWQELLRRRRESILSRHEMIGLFGELIFLRDLIVPRVSDPIASWRGPYGDEQDFAFGDLIVEIKTQLSTSDQRIYISSETQLDISSGRIVICHQSIANTSGSPGRTLTGLVNEIGNLVSACGPQSKLDFELALIEHDYTQRTEYDQDRWVLVSRKFYSVTDEFPRITPSMLAHGIQNVRYQIHMEACQRFEISIAEVMEQIVAKRN